MRIDIADAGYTLQISTGGLGDHSYLLFVGDAVVAIDPQRDHDRFEEIIADHAGTLVAVLETHIHNDYVSGGSMLASRHRADYVLPAGTDSAIGHRPLAGGQAIDIAAGWQIRALDTPGHTPQHNAYVLIGSNPDTIVFTGGSMLVGAVGRSDLLTPELTEDLARSQYRSVRRLASELTAPTIVGPTHGAGSFCSASTVADTISTIGLEQDRNPALLDGTEDSFLASQLAGYRLYPTYYRHMGHTNLRAVAAMSGDELPEIAGEIPDTSVVDMRSPEEFAAGHLPGSINIPAGDSVGVYAGWVLGWNTPLVLVGSEAEVADARTHLGRIGWDRVVGKITKGFGSRRLATNRVATFAELAIEQPTAVLDVRDPLEWADGVIGDPITIHMSEVPDRVAELPDGAVWIYCETGYRASVAAGFVQASGRDPVLVRDDFPRATRPT